MDKLSKPLNDYLVLAHMSSLLVDKSQLANLDVLLTMLGPVDKDMLTSYYGLFGNDVVSVDEMGRKYRVKPQTIKEIIEKDVHRLAITPEWQMMLRQLPPLVKRRIGFER